jgi:16S rRNA G966 N2-methylase RsmD
MTELRLCEEYPAQTLLAPTIDVLLAPVQSAAHWVQQHRGAASLIYADPPFATGARFPLRLGGQASSLARFDDLEGDASTLVESLHEELAAMVAALEPRGSLLLHCDPRTSPYFAVALDGLLGSGERRRGSRSAGFRNELVWAYGLGGSSPTSWPRKHDSILWYSRGAEWTFEAPRIPASSARMKGQDKKMTDVLNIPSLNNMAAERSGYPTQKPLELLELLVDAHTQAGALVFDPFAGSGTTGVACSRLGRACVLSDHSEDAVAVCRGRLLIAGAGVRIWRRTSAVGSLSRGVGAGCSEAGGWHLAVQGDLDPAGCLRARRWVVLPTRSPGRCDDPWSTEADAGPTWFWRTGDVGATAAVSPAD